MRAIATASSREQKHDQAEIVDVADLEAEDVDAVRADHVGAARAADVVPVHHESLQHHRERERRDREERAAQPQRQIAGAEPDQPGHASRDDEQHRDRQRIGLVEEHRCVGAESEEPGCAEIHVPAVAAENIPGRGQHDELHDRVAGEEQVVVADQQGDDERQCGGADRSSKEGGETHGLASHEAGRPHRQRQEQQTERDRRRPRGPVDRRREALDDAEQHARRSACPAGCRARRAR